MNNTCVEIAFCDDHLADRNQLKKELQEYFTQKHMDYTLHTFTTPRDVFDYMERHPIHILFMDLEFGSIGEDGIHWTKIINNTFPNTLVLILTAYEQRYKEGYRARAFRFMTKPLLAKELEENLDDCIKELDELSTVAIHQKSTELLLPAKNIIYLEAYIGGSTLHMTGEKFYHSEENLTWWEHQLQSPPFFRIHKSYLVNMAHITDILPARHAVLIGTSLRLPVSRRKWTEFQRSFMRYDVGKICR